MVESSHEPHQFKNAVKKYTDSQQLAFDELKLSLPEEMMKRAEKRIPEMITVKGRLAELFE